MGYIERHTRRNLSANIDDLSILYKRRSDGSPRTPFINIYLKVVSDLELFCVD